MLRPAPFSNTRIVTSRPTGSYLSSTVWVRSFSPISCMIQSSAGMLPKGGSIAVSCSKVKLMALKKPWPALLLMIVGPRLGPPMEVRFGK